MGMLWIFITSFVVVGLAVFRKDLVLAWKEMKEEKQKKDVFFKTTGVKQKKFDSEMSNISGNGME